MNIENESTNEEFDEISNSEEVMPSEMPVSVGLQGVVVNEVFPDPDAGSSAEFVELFNTSGTAVDISGWTLQDEGVGTWHTFPSGTTIAPGGFISVPNPGSSGILNNGGDSVYLVDAAGNYVIYTYNGDTPNEADTSLTLGGTNMGVEDIGNDVDGSSIQRFPDGSMTYVNDQAATPGVTNECFLTGTKILTRNGYKNVEDLMIGEAIQTAEGTFETIKWVGRQTIDPANIQNPLKGNPILIKANALGENVPSKDLYVSPGHSIFVEDLLIDAGALVNEVTILSTRPSAPFQYHHIELDKHVLLVAEGAAVESYLPQKENRDAFDNAAEYDALYPDGRKIILWPLNYPRISAKNKVPDYISEKLLPSIKDKKTA